jgi:lactose/L-arabinose transport system ATP-binding protein
VEMRVEIARLHNEIGATMIYVTHDQVEAMTMADKIVVLRAGRIEQVGAPLELYRNPDNKFVAGFIGSPSMNFLDCTVKGKNISHSAFVKATKPTVAFAQGTTAVTMGVRPEHLNIVAGDELSVELTEALGGVSYAYLRADDGTRLIVEERGDERSKQGDRVGLTFEPKRALMFDATTEERLR